MARLVWDSPGVRTYEYGVDRGVYYPPTGFGVAWRGLTNVTENLDAEIETSYLDGIAFGQFKSNTVFSAEIEALSLPPDFDSALGIRRPAPFLAITQQPRLAFGMSYRTMIGDDVGGREGAYKIHILYNASIDPSEKEHVTKSEEVEPTSLIFPIRCIPELHGQWAIAHLEVPSTDPKIGDLEDVLYGTAATNPQLPTLAQAFTILEWISYG